MAALRSTNNPPKIVPRVYLDGRDISFYMAMANDHSLFRKTILLITMMIQEKRFDGLIWDNPFNFFEKDRQQLNIFIIEFIKGLRVELGSEKIIMFNMANPMGKRQKLNIE